MAKKCRTPFMDVPNRTKAVIFVIKILLELTLKVLWGKRSAKRQRINFKKTVFSSNIIHMHTVYDIYFV